MPTRCSVPKTSQQVAAGARGPGLGGDSGGGAGAGTDHSDQGARSAGTPAGARNTTRLAGLEGRGGRRRAVRGPGQHTHNADEPGWGGVDGGARQSSGERLAACGGGAGGAGGAGEGLERAGKAGGGAHPAASQAGRSGAARPGAPRGGCRGLGAAPGGGCWLPGRRGAREGGQRGPATRSAAAPRTAPARPFAAPGCCWRTRRGGAWLRRGAGRTRGAGTRARLLGAGHGLGGAHMEACWAGEGQGGEEGRGKCGLGRGETPQGSGPCCLLGPIAWSAQSPRLVRPTGSSTRHEAPAGPAGRSLFSRPCRGAGALCRRPLRRRPAPCPGGPRLCWP